MSDTGSSSVLHTASPQTPKGRHLLQHPVVVGGHDFGGTNTTVENTRLENPFVSTVRSSPLTNRLSKSQSSSTTFIGPSPLPLLERPSNSKMLTNSGSSKTGPRLALYRSNSSLDLLDRDNYLLRGRNLQSHAQVHKEHSTTQGCFTRRKDFGSHGSIDVLSNSVTVVSCSATGCKVPPMATRRESETHSQGQEGHLVPKPPPGDLVITASPRLRLKFQKLFESKDHKEIPSPSKSDQSSSSSSTTSIFRKFRGGKESLPEIPSEPETTKPVLRHHQLLGTEERFRRRVFAHYDCQSVSANISYAAKLRGMLSKRRNTTTGASAASLGNRLSTLATPSTSLNNIGAICASENNSSLELPSQEADLGDGRTNALVLSCPYFRNEIGGEEEHIISSTKFNRIFKHSESTYSDRGGGGQKVELPRSALGRDETHRAHSARSLSILEWSPGRSHWTQGTCPYKGPRSSALEAVDLGAEYYRTYFYKQDHENWFGSDEVLGPLAISIKREKVESDKKDGGTNTGGCRYLYRLIARSTELNTLRGSLLEDGIKVNSKDRGIHSKEVIEFVLPEVQLQCLRLAQSGSGTEEQLLKVDQQILTHRHKIGIMYCRSGQGTEEEMYNNEEAGPAFNEFLDLIGQRVRLKGFDKYTGGLDNKDDSTGLYSIYSAYQDCEVIFHVSTLLPFTPNNRQQLMRKRHIGNDIVTIVFQEQGSQPFTPKNIRSQFQHVFIVVRAINPCKEGTYYSVAVSRSKEVPLFGPPIPEGAQFPKGKTFVDFLLSKAINAENATYRSEKFTTMATRTRQEYLKDLVASYATSTQLDPRPKFSMLQFGNRKKEQIKPKYNPDAILRGALSWSVWLQDWVNSRIDTFMAISSDTVVVIDALTRESIFALPTTSILGWNSGIDNCLRIFYHQGECITIEAKELGYGSPTEVDDLKEIIQRLEVVTDGCETQDFILRRNEIGQLGFHVQQDGVITEVEPCGYAAKAGLKQGSRLVEICKLVVATLSQDEMIDCLKNLNDVVVTIVPPLPDDNVRRGCDAKHCIYTADTEGEYYENSYGSLTSQRPSDFECHPYQQPFVLNNCNNVNSKSLLTQAVPGNHRKRYEPRSFSPPRSSNSSGYGTGSSSKSFSSDPHSLPYQEGDCTKLNGNEQWYDFLQEKPIPKDGMTCSPPPIPARNFHNKLRSNRQTHPVANGNGQVCTYETNGESNGNVLASRRIIGNGYFPAPYLEKSFTAKREYFQRNGSFQLSPSKSHDLLHIHNNFGGSPTHRPVPSWYNNGHGDYEKMNPLLVEIEPKKVVVGLPGPIYQMTKNVTLSNSPVIETTLKGKVTYLTDFPLKQVSTSEPLTSLLSDKDVESVKNERLAALKTAYLEKTRQSVETNQFPPKYSSPPGRELMASGQHEEPTPALVRLRGTGTSSLASSRTSSNSTCSPTSTEVKLRPSSTTSRNVNSCSSGSNRNSTLQEDLMRLINPDYLLQDNLPTTNCSPPSLKSSPQGSSARNLTSTELESTRYTSTSTTRDSVSKDFDRFDSPPLSSSSLSPQSSTKTQPSDNQLSSSSTSSLSTRSVSRLSTETAPPQTPSPNWREEVQNGVDGKIKKNSLDKFPNPLPESVFNLESRVSQLEAELRKEQESKQVLASKVENLQQENRRLLAENHITQDQFNKILQTLEAAAKKP